MGPEEREAGKTFSQIEWENEQEAERQMNYGPDEDEREREAEKRANRNPEEEANYRKISLTNHGRHFEGIIELDKIKFFDPRKGEGIEITQNENDSFKGSFSILGDYDTTIDNLYYLISNDSSIEYLKENAKYLLPDYKIQTLKFDPQNLALISNVLSSGKSQTVENSELGEIYVDKGLTGKKGYGLQHIIEGRSHKDKFGEDEISALLCKVVDSVQNGKIAIEQPKFVGGRDAGRIGIEKDGIIGFVSKTRGDRDEKFVITGFAINEKKEEAAEAIQAVIAQYGSTPAFSDIRKQVGAVVSSLHQVSPQIGEMSSGPAESNKPHDRQIEAAKKAGYVQGVCECIAAIGDDHALGKKLLSEMHVTKDQAKQYAKPETYKALEQGIFAPKQEQKIEQKQGVKR